MNPALNKKVKKFLDAYFKGTKASSPEAHHALMFILKGALTDANFHSEAKKVDKLFPKAKGAKYFGKQDWEYNLEDKGADIAAMAKWDGYDIVDAIGYFASMYIGKPMGDKISGLKTESARHELQELKQNLEEKNCPNDASKWSYYVGKAKDKFDVYPSAYANAWASGEYKKAGGTWRKCKNESVNEGRYGTFDNKESKTVDKALDSAYKKFETILKKAHEAFKKEVKQYTTGNKKDIGNKSGFNDSEGRQAIHYFTMKAIKNSLGMDEWGGALDYKIGWMYESINEGMVEPSRGHHYYTLTKDTPIKFISGHYGIGLEVPGVLLHNEYSTFKGKKGAYIIDYYGAHFYVDLKNKFASKIANPRDYEQNRDLMKNIKSVDKAPQFADWKKYMKEK